MNDTKKFLSTADISRITGVSEEYIKACVSTGMLTPEFHACESIVAVGGQEKEAEACILEGRPFVPKLRTVSAYENFITFWKSPYGKKRLCGPKMVREVLALKKGYPPGYVNAALDADVDKFLSNIYSKMKDDEDLEVLTPEKVLTAMNA